MNNETHFMIAGSMAQWLGEGDHMQVGRYIEKTIIESGKLSSSVKGKTAWGIH